MSQVKAPKVCTDAEHFDVGVDHFSKLPGVRRYTPGDCWCHICRKAIPLWWNGGQPIPVEQTGGAK